MLTFVEQLQEFRGALYHDSRTETIQYGKTVKNASLRHRSRLQQNRRFRIRRFAIIARIQLTKR